MNRSDPFPVSDLHLMQEGRYNEVLSFLPFTCAGILCSPKESSLNELVVTALLVWVLPMIARALN